MGQYLQPVGEKSAVRAERVAVLGSSGGSMTAISSIGMGHLVAGARRSGSTDADRAGAPAFCLLANKATLLEKPQQRLWQLVGLGQGGDGRLDQDLGRHQLALLGRQIHIHDR